MSKVNYILFGIVGIVLYLVTKKPAASAGYAPIGTYIPPPAPVVTPAQYALPPAVQQTVNQVGNTVQQVGQIAGSIGALASGIGSFVSSFGDSGSGDYSTSEEW